MFPRGELTRGRQTLHGLLLPHRVRAVDQLENARLEYEEAAVDQSALGLRLLRERQCPAAVDDHTAEARRRTHTGDGRLQSPLLVKGDLRSDIDVREPIAVGHAERLVRIEVLAHLQEPSTGHCLLPGVPT